MTANLEKLNNSQFRIKMRTGTNIDNVKDPIIGEMLIEVPRQDDISFDGQSKIDTDYTFGGGEISLSAWIKTTNNKKFIIASDSPTGGNNTSFAIGFDDSNKAYILIGNPSQEIYKTGSVSAINDDNWHNIIVTIDSSYVMNFYIDGTLETSHTFSIPPGQSDYVTHYGSGWSDGAEPLYDTWGLGGQLNGLGIWERVLTDKEINIISSSGRYSPAPSRFSPDLWVGSTYPALYTCANKDGTISKLADLTAKMGDVPMLKINQQQFQDSGNFTAVPSFAYSFWFYDDGVGTGRHFLVQNSTAANNSIEVLHDSNELILGSHGDFAGTCHETNHGPNCAHFLDSSIATSSNINLSLKYEKYKLNHLLVVKKAGTVAPAHNTGSCWVYLNGKLAASIIEAGYHTYPSTTCFAKFNHTSAASEMMIGDVAYWNQDVSSVVDEILDPIGGHKGQQGNLMNMSIEPHHYWKFGAPMQGGEIKDIGTDGTNHQVPNNIATNGYQYKNIFGIDRSAE